MHPIAYIVMLFGACLALVGIFFFLKRGAEDTNTIKLLGVELNLGGSVLFVVLGVGLIALPFIPIVHFPQLRQAFTPSEPSFDCTKATSRSERLVCASPELRVLDLEMSNAYRDALARSPQRAPELRAAQNDWLRKAREQCTDAPCLKDAYVVRITDLKRHQP